MNLENLVLRPNCLLTRAPLVFVSGPRSLFEPNPLGNNLQKFLRAHGYQVSFLWMPFRSLTLRNAALISFFAIAPKKKFHFVMAKDTWNELRPVFENNPLQIVSITMINPSSTDFTSTLAPELFKSFKNNSNAPLSYRLHRFFCWALGSRALPFDQTLLEKDKILYDRFLDHCIELAENE